jgi:hypothetical protein
MATDTVQLDLNSPVFQRDWFGLEKREQTALLTTLKKIRALTWPEVQTDAGLKWEAIQSRRGPDGQRLCSLRISRSFRALAYREGAWLRLLSLHPDHDSADR